MPLDNKVFRIEENGQNGEFTNFVDGRDFSKAIESAILGICLWEPESASLIAGLIESKHFYIDANRVVAEAIIRINKSGGAVTIFTVINELNTGGVLSINGNNVPYHLTKLQDGVTSSAGVMQLVASLVSMWKIRTMVGISDLVKSTILDPIETLEKIEEVVDEIRRSSGSTFVTSSDAVLDIGRHKEEVMNGKEFGVTTGFHSMDRETGGFDGGCLYIIAARPSVGKTALMGRCVLGAATKGKHVGIIQLEMSVKQTNARLLALHGDMTYAEILAGFKDDEDRENFYQKMGSLSGLPFYINPSATMTLEAIKSWAHSMKHEGKLDILFIDYLQLIEVNGNRSREQDVSAISRGLKSLARTLNIPVVALSQLNRAIETRANRRPVLSDLRESGAIEQDADAVYFVHRDFAMGIEVDADGNSTVNEAELIFAKNRNGARGPIPLKFDGAKMKFYEQSWLDNRPNPF